ncbi:MAG: dihydroneopterin aldolase [Gemmatimonadaceae bacterium]
MPLIFVVRLEAMRFHTRIGVLPHEAEISQPIELDVAAWVARDESARGADGVLDYRRLYAMVSSVLSEGHVLYLEDLAATIAEQALVFDGVTRVMVNARKPHVAIGGPLAYAQVTLERARDE